MHEHDPQIVEYEHEKFRPREAEALQTLRKVASLVKPIMRQRGWTVGTLAEFWPPEKNLLGVNWNKGQKICLRLRYPSDERQFLPIEEVVDTMLHELCHIVHGPHDEPFHKLWNQLRDEHENLIRKGYTGEGFLSNGHKLGGGRIPMHEARRRARAAAEKRQTLNAGSGQKLGGRSVRRGEDIRKVIADAATRRSTVERGCASGTERGQGLVEETTRNGFRTKAEEDDANEDAIMQAYIEMIQEEEREKYGNDYVQPSKSNPAGTQGRSIPQGFKPGLPTPVPEFTKPSIPTNSKPPQAAYTMPDMSTHGWSCDICTLHNPSNYLLIFKIYGQTTATFLGQAKESTQQVYQISVFAFGREQQEASGMGMPPVRKLHGKRVVDMCWMWDYEAKLVAFLRSSGFSDGKGINII
ncbi:hypothetical protein MMC26_002998 [Xylographa opegraphella]|nr:hypothetical protein [Xylographa opegraphella]